MDITAHITHLKQALKQKYDTPYSFAYAPFDKEAFDASRKLYERLNLSHVEVMVLVGIGGSNLGFQALRQLLQKSKTLWYELDTFSPSFSHSLYQQIGKHLAQKQRVLFIIISKSGKTTETLLNAALCRQLLDEYEVDARSALVIISDEGSPLIQLAVRESYEHLTIPPRLGGRFSLFSAVGYFPLLCASIDVEGLIEGAQDATNKALSLEHNEALQSAFWFVNNYNNNKSMITIFVTDPALYMFGLWYRQLIAESLGKSGDKGPTPLVALATTDLHSMLQLYLAGPDNKMTRFFTLHHDGISYGLPHNEFSDLLDVARHITLEHIHCSIIQGVQKSYALKQREFVNTHVAGTPYSIGFLMQQLMFEVVYSGLLFEVNPFDQPEVELYKQETRFYLSQY